MIQSQTMRAVLQQQGGSGDMEPCYVLSGGQRFQFTSREFLSGKFQRAKYRPTSHARLAVSLCKQLTSLLTVLMGI